jgi:hypothetical protein
MSYTVNNFNGLLLTTINDGQVDTTSSPLQLLGKGIPNYGEAIAENFVHLLENFARTSPPPNPLIGQFWYHIDANGVGNHVMKVCKNTSPVSWVVLSGVVTGQGTGTSSGFPAAPVDGDLYWDGHQLWAWDNGQSKWILIAPMSTPSENTFVSFQGDLVSDGTRFYNIIKIVVNGKIIAIFSDNTTSFTPNPAIDDGKGNLTSFPVMYGGMTLHADYLNLTPYAPLNASSHPTVDKTYDFGASNFRWKTMYADVIDTNSLKVSGSTIPVSSFMRLDLTNVPTDPLLNLGSTTNPWGTSYMKSLFLIDDPSQLNSGDGVLQIPVGTTAQRPAGANAGTIRYNTTISSFEGKGGSGQWSSLGGVKDVDGDTFISAENSPGANNNELKFVAGNTQRLVMGSTTSTFYGTWTLATGATMQTTLADLAERYAVDNIVEPGDVVKIGGDAEITKTTSRYDTDVFGVISDTAALKMNCEAGSDKTHPYVALSGRVMVKVTGPVTKGQRLVSSSVPGVAMAISSSDASENILAIIGRALESSNITGIKLIETVVGAK